jgi:hypothetical protein
VVTDSQTAEATAPGPLGEGDEPELGHVDAGKVVRTIGIDVDYAIIKHFSEHLYSSPNKAIEELVSNGFDALATRCYVYVPGEHVQDRVVVWDDGTSMDEEGIEAMWHIARSPKSALGPERLIEDETLGVRRRVIGKFGIGKLASYAVGHRITHVCRTDSGEYLAVTVNYRLFSREDDDLLPEQDGPHKVNTDVRELTEDECRQIVEDMIPSGEAFDFMWARPHWTLAVIDDLRTDKSLYPGRLSWVLGNGMPLRDNFRVWVEDKEVAPRLADKAKTTWTFANAELTDSLTKTWNEALGAGKVDGEVDLAPAALEATAYEPGEPGATDPAVMFPVLGRVTVTVRLFEDAIGTSSSDERNHGFFLMVLGRLVNPDDDKLLLNDPSFETFYRSQFTIRADGLDAELLADRESLRRDTPMSAELRVLQTALYRAARAEVTSNDNDRTSKRRSETWLPVRSRELFRDPMAALAVRAAQTGVDLDNPRIERTSLGEAEAMAVFEEATGVLNVNADHPFMAEAKRQAGDGKVGKAVMRLFELLAVSERLTEGFLFTRGFNEDQVADVLQWRDRLLRSLAQSFSSNPDEVLVELGAASYEGGKRFENAIAALFRFMGFAATRNGAPGKEDILAEAPVGPGHTKFTIEAKGSTGSVANDDAEVSAAANHRDACGAEHAIIVAREFKGFATGDTPAILMECESVTKVSLVTVDVLKALHEAMSRYAYPLSAVTEVLFINESPALKLQRVSSMTKPLQSFDLPRVLAEIWQEQQSFAQGSSVSLLTQWQRSAEKAAGMTQSEFVSRLSAIQHFAGELMVVDAHTIYLTQAPDHILARVQSALEQPVPSS